MLKSHRMERPFGKCSNNCAYLFFAFIILSCLLFTYNGIASDSPAESKANKLKILHIMSYHYPWKWTEDQLNGFKFALKDVNIEYKIFQMDTKRKSGEGWKQKVANEAIELIKEWKPDLVYTNDDNAQQYVVTKFVNDEIPFVFSGVNADPAKYGFVGSKNITGVLEQEHFIASINLLKKIVPKVKKIAVILDDGPTWPGVTRRMKSKLNQIQDVEFTRWEVIKTFSQYKDMITSLQNEVHAIALLGIFTYKDIDGKNVKYTDVLKWTAEHSRLPDFSFWADRISNGTLCAVTVSGYEQGLAAGKIARKILIDGHRPNSIPMVPTLKGEPMVSLARANKLGLTLETEILLFSQVIDKFNWEK